MTVVRCSTTLLFPFVTNRFGFDTGIAVSNPNRLLTSVTDGITGLQCEHLEDTFQVHLEEGFAAAFKTLGLPSFANADNATENGYPVLVSNNPGAAPQSIGGTGGGATQATRFIIRFYNVPMGLTITG